MNPENLPDKPKMGRPRKEFDFNHFESLCRMHCTKSEICDFFCITDKTLDARIREHYSNDQGDPATFSDVYKWYEAEGKSSLRHAQFQAAIERGNVFMQRWLGIQYLNQKEKTDVSSNGETIGRVHLVVDEKTKENIEGIINGFSDRIKGNENI